MGVACCTGSAPAPEQEGDKTKTDLIRATLHTVYIYTSMLHVFQVSHLPAVDLSCNGRLVAFIS